MNASNGQGTVIAIMPNLPHPLESLSFYFHRIKQLRLLTLPGEDIAHRIVKWCSHFGKQFDIHENIKHVVTTLASNSTPRYISKRMEAVRPCKKNVYANVHGNIVHRS